MKKAIVLLGSIIALGSQAFADEQLVPVEEQLRQAKAEAIEAQFLESFEEGQARAELERVEPVQHENIQKEQQIDEQPQNFELMGQLQREVKRLKQQQVISKRNDDGTRSPSEARPLGVITNYTWKEGQIYQVHTAMESTTEIILGPGEYIEDDITLPLGKEAWNAFTKEIGSGTQRRTSLFITPKYEKLEVVAAIPTNKRVYRIHIIPSDTFMPVIRWQYPGEEEERQRLIAQLKKEKEKRTIKYNTYRAGYYIEGDNPDWTPVHVFDDGQDTYIEFPETQKLPIAFVFDENVDDKDKAAEIKPFFDVTKTLKKLNGVHKQLELRLGDRTVEISSPDVERSFWDNLF